mmetsp:Transcript_6752/g.16518  ORF Transcript_6752/g.16518 Transcript_6752/m.16518 type:complete len:315 (+) Transcript_6752:1613-2557(+)
MEEAGQCRAQVRAGDGGFATSCRHVDHGWRHADDIFPVLFRQRRADVVHPRRAISSEQHVFGLERCERQVQDAFRCGFVRDAKWVNIHVPPCRELVVYGGEIFHSVAVHQFVVHQCVRSLRLFLFQELHQPVSVGVLVLGHQREHLLHVELLRQVPDLVRVRRKILQHEAVHPEPRHVGEQLEGDRQGNHLPLGEHVVHQDTRLGLALQLLVEHLVHVHGRGGLHAGGPLGAERALVAAGRPEANRHLGAERLLDQGRSLQLQRTQKLGRRHPRHFCRAFHDFRESCQHVCHLFSEAELVVVFRLFLCEPRRDS